MKILHVTKKYPPLIGGDASVVQSLEREQVKQGHSVFILTNKTLNTAQSSNVYTFGIQEDVYNLDKITAKRILSLGLLFLTSFSFLKKIKPAIIHTHSSDIGFILSFVAKIYKIPIINTCHGVTFTDKQYSYVKRVIEKFLLKYALFSSIITVDKTSPPAFKKARINPVTYIPNGVNTKFFTPSNKERGRGRFNFLFVGRLEKQKGLYYLIEAVKLLTVSQKNFKLIIVGEGSMENTLKKQVKQSKLENIILFAGKKNMQEIKSYYQQANVLILPSLWEGFPLTILEAWSSGIAVIATKVGCAPVICTDKKNAMLVSKKNPSELASAMITLLTNHTYTKSLGQQGRTLANKKYSWKKIALQINDIYKNTIIKYENN